MTFEQHVLVKGVWQAGLTLKAYIEQMEELRPAMERRLAEVTLSAEDVWFFEGVNGRATSWH